MFKKSWTLLLAAGLLGFTSVGSAGSAPQLSAADLLALSRDAVKSALSSAPEQDPGDTRPLVIFYVHGWTGNATTSFCDMPALLEKLYNSDGKKRVLSKLLSYSTMSDTMTTTDFAREIYPQMEQFFKDNGLKSDNPYSLIMHSQGGTVGVKFVQICVRQKSKSCTGGVEDSYGTLTNLRHFISLAAPFWGSNSVGYYDSVKKYIHLNVPDKQTSELGIGSQGLTTDREYLIHKNILKQAFFPAQTQVYALGGDISDVFGLNLIDPVEFDVAVELPNSHLDFNYYFEQYPNDATPLIGQSLETREWKTLRVAHSPIDNFALHQLGVACVKSDQIDPVNSKTFHPTYPFLKKWLDRYFGIQDPLFAVAAEKASSVERVINFGVEFKIRLPDGYEGREISMGDSNVTMDVDPNEITKTRHSNTLVTKLHGIRRDDPGKNRYVTYYHVGDLSDAFAYNATLGDDPQPKTAHVKYTIRVPGFQDKVLTLPVNAGRTTFANIYLEPIQPIAPITEAADPRKMYPNYTVVAVIQPYGKPAQLWAVNPLDPFAKLTASAAGDISLGLDRITNLCYVGVALTNVNTSSIPVYSDFTASSAVKMNLQDAETVNILGRMNRTEKDGNHVRLWEEDRYLVTSRSIQRFDHARTISVDKGVGWINVRDVEVYPEGTCLPLPL